MKASTTSSRPGVVVAAATVAVIVGLLMVLGGFGMTRMQWNRAAQTQEELDYMRSVLTMVRALGVLVIVLGAASTVTAAGMLRPVRRWRTALTVAGGLGIAVLSLGWVLKLVPVTVAALALGLGLALLLAYRPAAKKFYDGVVDAPVGSAGGGVDSGEGEL